MAFTRASLFTAGEVVTAADLDGFSRVNPAFDPRAASGALVVVRRPGRFIAEGQPGVVAVAVVALAASATSRPVSRRALLGLGLFTKDSL